ncbi:DUF805 domain-containing protein [Patescibacteria group bacterium]|nr:DUF805 domain-containing protein [Patescibacteria group bacterium]
MDILLEQFSKKIGRGDFAIRYIPTLIIVFFITGGVWNPNLSPIEGIILIIAGVYGISLCIQRLNDLELSRWYALLTLVPIVNLVFGVVLFTRKGNTVSTPTQTHKSNKWFVEIPAGETKNVSAKIVEAAVKPHEKTSAISTLPISTSLEPNHADELRTTSLIIVALVMIGGFVIYIFNKSQPISILQSSTPTTTTSQTPSPIPSSISSNPDYLKNPSAYLVDYDNKTSSEIPTGKMLWVEEIKNSVLLKVSYPIVKAGQNIIVFHDLQIPGLSTSIYGRAVDKSEPDPCEEKAAVDFLTRNLLHTEVFLSYEGMYDTTTWRLLMTTSNADVAYFIILNGYGMSNKWQMSLVKTDWSVGLLAYPGGKLASPRSLATLADELKDAQNVASLAKRGFWGTCQ